ncbi:MAG TPA: hypothetical protein VH279_02465 [Solirubrobacteraceae bacterium]|jgi:hypothetical protein|nr:hypothetical protein [Solirubrobacteraceae bacterium]
MASFRLGPLTRCMVAIGAKRYRLERRCGHGSARFVAFHPESLEQILRLGELHYRDTAAASWTWWASSS